MYEVKVSIVTVCYNSEDTIENTILSVINQNFNSFEYLIVDGKSTDNTINIVKKYSQKNKKMHYISEEDSGIYDAMNKAINICKGEYIFFLNSGDLFYNDNILNSIFSENTNKGYDIIFGNAIETNLNGSMERKYNKKINKLYFIRGNGICHQVIFAKKSTFINNKFDLKYKICADKNWLIKSFIKGYELKYFDLIISYYDRTGISSNINNSAILKNETKDIILNNFKVLGRLKYFIGEHLLKSNDVGRV